jgi:dienelactone hydrolase
MRIRSLFIALAASVALAPGAIAGEPVTYEVDGVAYEGYLAEATREPRGLVIVIHDWDGLTDYEVTRAEMLADMGYDAFAVDLYGAGNRPDTTEAKKAEVGKLYNDREAMRTRILGGIETAREATGGTRAAVMGYCFGGSAVLELARSGRGDEIAGYASFHGGLSTPDGQDYSAVNAPVLIAHGGADASIPNSQAADLATRLEDAGKDYLLEVYSGAPHAFTVFGSERYRKQADETSWTSFSKMLDSAFGEPG